MASCPGTSCIDAGLTVAVRASSGSSTRSDSPVGALPAFTSRTRDLAEPLVSTVWGTRVAPSSLNGSTSTTPSSTTEKPGSSCDRTRTPNGFEPAVTAVERGGMKRTSAVPWAPGNRFTEAGSTVAHPEDGPTTSTAKTSTTLPSLRIRTVALAVEPGVTVTDSGLRTTDAPIGGW